MKDIINNSKYWYLQDLKYTDELVVRIAEGIESEDEQDIIIGGENLARARAVDITGQSKVIEIIFAHVLAYNVTDESYTEWDDEEQFKGLVFREYTKSHYLNFLSNHTLIEKLEGGNYSHYALVLCDDIVDVIAKGEPEFRRIN